jgi:hypothetical protein
LHIVEGILHVLQVPFPRCCDAPGPSAEDVAKAIKVGTQAHEAAATILKQDVLTTW